MPLEIIQIIARHLTEWNDPNVLNESNDLDVETQWATMYGHRGSTDIDQLIETSAYHKLSSFLFTFRLVCKKCAAAGLEVFLECARTDRYAHYTTLHLPPPARMSIPGLTGMLIRQPSLSNRITELIIHVIPECVPPVPDYQIKQWSDSVEHDEYELELCNDALRIFETYNNESLHCDQHFSHSDPNDPLQLLMFNIRRLRSVQI